MSELQRFEKVVIKYRNALFGQNITKRIAPDPALEEINKILEEMDKYLDSQAVIFVKWCNLSVRSFGYQRKIIFRLINFFWRIIINHNLNKYSYNMSKVGLMQDNLLAFKKRLLQIKAFCNN